MSATNYSQQNAFFRHNMFSMHKPHSGADYSTKFSPWLAHGCISPRLIYHRTTALEGRGGKVTLLAMMTWRDFFIFYCRAQNPKIFWLNGVRPRQHAQWLSARDGEPLFQKWRKGETGHPLVDASMRELAATGYLSNRGRLIVSSFLVFDYRGETDTYS